MDPSKAVDHAFSPQQVAWNKRDLILYALGLGVTEPAFTYENSQEFAALPTFPLVLRLKGTSADVNVFGSQQTFKDIPGLPENLPLNQMLHGEQYLEILKPIPLRSDEGQTHLDVKITGVYDKGTQMQIERTSQLVSNTGEVYCKMVNTLSVVGMGGWGGDQGPPMEKWRHPPRESDVRLEHSTFDWQNMLYRLSGDYNPVHADAEYAKTCGWHAPTFQGMATFAIAAYELSRKFGSSANSLKSIKARFVQPVFPGETLEVLAWDVTDNRGKAEGGVSLLFQVRCKERDVVILSNGVCHLHSNQSQDKKGHYSKL